MVLKCVEYIILIDTPQNPMIDHHTYIYIYVCMYICIIIILPVLSILHHFGVSLLFTDQPISKNVSKDLLPSLLVWGSNSHDFPKALAAQGGEGGSVSGVQLGAFRVLFCLRTHVFLLSAAVGASALCLNSARSSRYRHGNWPTYITYIIPDSSVKLVIKSDK